MFLLKWFKSSHSKYPPSDTVTAIVSLDPNSDTVTLMDMPDLVMTKILEDVDLMSIMNLRKVNRALQYFIDETQPQNLHLDSIKMKIEGHIIRMKLEKSKTIQSRNALKYSDISFHQVDETRFVSFMNGDVRNQKCSRARGGDYMEAFETFMDGILHNLKSPLRILEFGICRQIFTESNEPTFFESIFEGVCIPRVDRSVKILHEPGNEFIHCFDRILKSMKPGKFQVENLKLLNFKLDQVTELMTVMQPDMLNGSVLDRVLNSETIRKSTRLTLYLKMDESHVRVLKMGNMVQHLTAQDLLYCLALFFTSPHLETTTIHFDEILSDEEVTSVFGPSTNAYAPIWFFEGFPRRLKLTIDKNNKFALFQWMTEGGEEPQ